MEKANLEALSQLSSSRAAERGGESILSRMRNSRLSLVLLLSLLLLPACDSQSDSVSANTNEPAPAPTLSHQEIQANNEKYKELLAKYFTELRKAYVDGDQEKIQQLLEQFREEQQEQGLTESVALFDVNTFQGWKRKWAFEILFQLCETGSCDRETEWSQNFIKMLRAFRALEKAETLEEFAQPYRELNTLVETTGISLHDIGESPWSVTGMHMELIAKADGEGQEGRK